MRRVAAIFLTLTFMPSASAHISGEAPIAFRGVGTALITGPGPNGTTGVQSHDHPYSVTSPRGPFVLPGMADARVLTARAAAGRPGAARTQTASAEAADVVVLPGSPFEVRATLVRGEASAVCADGAVTPTGDSVVRGLTFGGTAVPLPGEDPDGVVVSAGPVLIIANEQTISADGIVVSALHITGLPIGDVWIGRAEAAVLGCPTDEQWGRGPDAGVSLQTSGPSSGEGTFTRSISCTDGGHGDYHHFDYTSAIDAADSSPSSQALAGRLDAFLDVHVADVLGQKRESAFLLGSESLVVVSNARGSITAELESGDCNSPTIARTASGFSGGGTWTVIDSTGSFREARGQGTFAFSSTVGPGTDNPLSLSLDGVVSVLLPHLTFQTDGARWTLQSFLDGRLSAALEIQNDGPGDAFDVAMQNVTPLTGGVSFTDPALPHPAGNLDLGEDSSSTLRFVVPLLGCDRAGCTVPFGLGVGALTALNQPVGFTGLETVVAPGGPS